MQSPIQGKFLEEDDPNEVVDSVFGQLGTDSAPATLATPASNPQTGIYQVGGGHPGQLNIMGDSFLDRGDFNRSSASTVAAATRTAADQVDMAVDLLENHYPDVQAAAAAAQGFNNSDQLASEEGRQQMLSQLKTVQAALNNPDVYTNIVLDASDSGEGRLGYTPFLTYAGHDTNLVTGFVHITPLYFASNPNTDPVQQAAAQATTVLHELGRYYNSLGESLTGTKYDVYAWDNKIQFLNNHYTGITGKK